MLAGVALVAAALVYFVRQRQSRIAFVRAQGWQWVGRDAGALPDWLIETRASRVGTLLGPNVRLRNLFVGNDGSLSVCGFQKETFAKSGHAAASLQTFLFLHDPGLREPLPEVLFTQSGTLGDTIARNLGEITSEETGGYRLRESLPGFERWTVRASEAGELWLRSAAGQHLASALAAFEPRPYHGFGMSGSVAFAEGIDLSSRRLEALHADLGAFHRRVAGALASKPGSE